MPKAKNGKIDFKKLLNDKTAYADDMVISIGDATVSIGDLREANAESEGQLLKDLEARTKELDTREGKLASAQAQLVDMYEALAEQTGVDPLDAAERGTLGDRKGKGGKGGRSAQRTAELLEDAGLDENDPLLRPVVAQLKALEARVDGVSKSEVGGLKKAMGLMLQTYLDDHYALQFERLKGDVPKKAKDVTLEKVIQYATTQKLVDQKGRLNIDRALKEMTEPFRLEATIAEAEERGRQKAMDEVRMGSLPRPGMSGQKHQKPPKNDDGSTKSIEQVMMDALEDPEIFGPKGVAFAGMGSA
jgi:hypothetical protein